MKIYNKHKIEELPPTINAELDKYRTSRNFSVEEYVKKKVNLLNQYFSRYNLSTAIVAVSGGIDSALVFALLNKAASVKNSPLKKVVPIFIPAYESNGVTGQHSAFLRAKELCDTFNVEMVELDISAHAKQLSQSIQSATDIKADNWSDGQLVPYLRTTSLYYFATLFTQNNQKAVIVGTTNADEGQYIGYFGKASDGLVDLQLISDIHKSEVYALSEYLGVPSSLLDVVPTGDMYDARVDEEVFGFPYDFIEFYRHYLSMTVFEQEKFKESLIFNGEIEIFNKLEQNVENMHRYNKHKYLGNSPAVHLDVIDTKIDCGWKYSNWTV